MAQEADSEPVLEPDIKPPTTGYRAEDNPSQSGLLVVLDDDQEDIPGTDSQHKGAGSGAQRPSTMLKVESFEDEDGGAKLPDLPKL